MVRINCAEYRDTRILLALRQRLAKNDLDHEERQRLEIELARLEDRLGLSSPAQIQS